MRRPARWTWSGPSSIARPGQLSPVIAGVLAVSGLVVTVVAAAGLLAGEGEALFLDVYETSGSRLASIGSNLGVLLWAAAASVSLFGAWLSRQDEALSRWSQFLAVSGLLTLLVLADDYLALHEIVSDTASSLTGIVGSTPLRNGSELLAFGLLGLAFAAYVIAFRGLLVRTEIGLLVVAGVLLACSLAIDMLPRSWPLAIGLPEWTVDLAEDVTKFLGIAMYAAYFIRTTALVLTGRASAVAPPARPPGA